MVQPLCDDTHVATVLCYHSFKVADFLLKLRIGVQTSCIRVSVCIHVYSVRYARERKRNTIMYQFGDDLCV